MSAAATLLFFIANVVVTLILSLTSLEVPIWHRSSFFMLIWLSYSVLSSLLSGYLYTFANCLDELVGVYSYYEICKKGEASRRPFYELSLPGGHPRMWNMLKNSCCHYINIVHDKFEGATYSKQRDQASEKCYEQTVHLLEESSDVTPLSSKLALDDKQRFFLPPSLNRHKNVLASKERSPITFFRRVIKVRAPIISFQETTCAKYAIRTLTCVVSHSLAEDNYGVVQRDLRPLIALLTRLSITIDAYIRSVQACKDGYDSNVRELDETLADSLKEIYLVFRDYIPALGLNPAELEIFEALSSPNAC